MFSILRRESRTLLSTVGSNRISSSSQLQAKPTATQRTSKVPKKTSKKLDLPTYETVEEIKYSTFIRELQEKNPDEKLRGKDIKRALRLKIIDMIGRDGFRKMKRSSAHGRSSNHWKALMEESREFSSDKQSGGRQRAKH